MADECKCWVCQENRRTAELEKTREVQCRPWDASSEEVVQLVLTPALKQQVEEWAKENGWRIFPIPTVEGDLSTFGIDRSVRRGGRLMKPCPFCGSRNVCGDEAKAPSFLGWIQCLECNARGPLVALTDRDRMWNDRSDPELEKTAGFLADCWIFLDAAARGEYVIPADARAILRKQKAPGWKDGG